jgi:hypothetical protein
MSSRSYRKSRRMAPYKKKRKNRLSGKGAVRLDLRSFSGQQVCSLRMPSGPVVLSTTVGTGLIAYVQAFDPQADVTNWSSRFQSLFSEFRIKMVEVHLVALTNTQGQAVVWWDEAASTLTTPPTFVEATERGQSFIPLSVNSSKSVHVYRWVPRDIKDLIFYSTNTTTFNTPVGFKLFTNNANYGSSVVATPAFNVTIFFTLEFRGYS